ncbi:hypothetical protein C9986_02170, partial [Pseudidiomarina aestuarii]
MDLIRDIQNHLDNQEIVAKALKQCQLQGTQVLAEGVETKEEFNFLVGLGIRLFQGYYLAKPAFEALVTVPFADIEANAMA